MNFPNTEITLSISDPSNECLADDVGVSCQNCGTGHLVLMFMLFPRSQIWVRRAVIYLSGSCDIVGVQNSEWK